MSSNVAIQLLFALLCLTALPLSPLRDELQLRQDLQAAVSYYGQVFLYAPPTSRHAFAALMLLAEYSPTALATSRNLASVAVKSEVYIHLAYRIAERLHFSSAEAKLQSWLQNPALSTPKDVSTALGEALQWCQMLYYDAILDSFHAKPIEAMRQISARMNSCIETIYAVLQLCPFTANTIYHAQFMKSACILIEDFTEVKANWRSLERLSEIMERSEQKCTQQREVSRQLLQAASAMGPKEEIEAATALLDLRFESVPASVSGAAIFFAMMSRLRAEREAGEINPGEAIQMSNAVIDCLKDPREDFRTFLQRLGRAKALRIERILAQFIDIANTLTLENVRFLPPPRRLVFELVLHCKNLVEDNAAQLRGWRQLHRNVDGHLSLFHGCAHQLEAMAAAIYGDTAFANGCLYAASARLIRNLHDVVAHWNETCVAGQGEYINGDGTRLRLAAGRDDSDGMFINNTWPNDYFDKELAEWGSWLKDDFSDFLLDNNLELP